MIHIHNKEQLAVTPMRRDALTIIESGLNAIDTDSLVRRQVTYDGQILAIAGRTFDLTGVRHLHIIGFGKVSCRAAAALNDILGTRAEPGIILGARPGMCEHVGHFPASHPMPSPENVAATEQMMLHCQDMHDDDLVIVIVSGGGSAMLCWPMTECDAGRQLYEAACRADLTIHELNTVRKHLSALKGGGLAKLLWPAQVVGLIFSDVPGANYELVASGPTYPDTTTVADAQAVIERHALGSYQLTETPKEPKYFERVQNIVLVSNQEALEAMALQARKLGYAPTIAGDDLYESPEDAIGRLLALATPRSVVLAGGEFRLRVPKDAGTGGRNMHAVLAVLGRLPPEDLFIAIASDGMDNTDAAGAIADSVTREHAHAVGLDATSFLGRFDEYHFFSQSGDLIMTGPIEANVSDLMVLVRAE